MPYLVLALGILALLYAFYRFFIRASADDVKTLFALLFGLIFAGILLFFAFTGRIIISLALLVLALPFVIAHFKAKSAAPKQDDNNKDA